MRLIPKRSGTVRTDHAPARLIDAVCAGSISEPAVVTAPVRHPFDQDPDSVYGRCKCGLTLGRHWEMDDSDWEAPVPASKSSSDEDEPLPPGVIGYAVALRMESGRLMLADSSLKSRREAAKECPRWGKHGRAVLCEVRAAET